jgi:hypothetical protein
MSTVGPSLMVAWGRGFCDGHACRWLSASAPSDQEGRDSPVPTGAGRAACRDALGPGCGRSRQAAPGGIRPPQVSRRAEPSADLLTRRCWAGAGECIVGSEHDRIESFGSMEDGLRQAGEWYRWGPYLSERQWGTVREDYSADGEAWGYLPHDHARSRAYRGVRTGWLVSPMWSSGCVWAWRCGTAGTRSSRSAPSG